MSTSILILASAALLAVQAPLQQSWSGFLLDDACRSANVSAKCTITGDTKSFGFETAGKYFKLDSDGNAKARTALGDGPGAAGDVKATVSGSLDGQTIKVANVELVR